MIYLDNAATTSPKPDAVIAAVNKALRQYSANPGRSGHAASLAAADQVFRARQLIASFFQCAHEENVVFTDNCTTALNTVFKGVLKPGDHVVISSLEHNAVLRPLESLKAAGISYTVAEVGENPDDTVDAFRNAINRHTRLIVCTHASNVFGTILPASRLCALAHSNGILFCLDAAQSVGVLPIDLDENRYDYVCCAGHKGLYGPMGTGILLINSNEIPLPLTAGGTGSSSADPAMPDYLPDRLESGTRNVPGIIGLAAGVSFVRSKGVPTIYRYEMQHIQALYEALSSIKGIQLYTPYPEYGAYAPVLSFTVAGTDSEAVAAYLNRQGVAVRAGLHCAPLAHRYMGTEQGGTVRVAPSAFTTRSQIQFFVNAMKNFAH